MPSMKTPSVAVLADLKDWLSYDPVTGSLTWAVHRQGTHGIGSPAGSVRKDRYRVVVVHGRPLMGHHIAWFLHTGSWPTERLFFKDRDPANMAFINISPVPKPMTDEEFYAHQASSPDVGREHRRRAALQCATDGREEYADKWFFDTMGAYFADFGLAAPPATYGECVALFKALDGGALS